MKKLIFTLLTCCTVYLQSNAQSCGPGTSGPSACSSGAGLSKPGLAPLSECLDIYYVDSTVNVTIQFQNYDTTSFNGATVTVDSLQIDTIANLPSGLCWKTNKSNNRFANKENGCINVSGTIDHADLAGQYQLYIVVDAWIHNIGDLTLNAAQEALYYYVRVKASPADTCPRLVDTTGQAHQTNLFVAYGANCGSGVGITCGEATSIHDVIAYINTLNIIPNPISSEATVQFNSTKTGKVTERITNVIGSEVYSNNLQLTLGENKHTIQKGNLAAGIYIYSITDGESVFSKKLVIE